MGVAVDVPHHVGEFMHLALTHHAALDLAVDIEHERIHAMRVDIPVDIQQGAAGEEGNVDRVPLLLRVIAPVPVLQQERLALGFVGIQPLKRGLQPHGVVFLRVIRNEHRLLRIVFRVPGKRMPRQFDNGSGILNRCGGRIPDDALNREPGNADVSLSKVHLLIPHDLRDRRAGNQEVLRPAAVELPDVVHLHDVLDHVVHVGCKARQILTLRNQHGFRCVVHLVGDAVVERGLQRLQLEHPVLLSRIRRILIGIFQAVDETALPRVIVIGSAVRLPQVKPGVGLPLEGFVLFGKLLLSDEQYRFSRAPQRTLLLGWLPLPRFFGRGRTVVSNRSHGRYRPPLLARHKASLLWCDTASQVQRPSDMPGTCTCMRRRYGLRRQCPRPPVWSDCTGAPGWSAARSYRS